MSESDRERILFVTGRLAAPALSRIVEQLGAIIGFDHDVAVLGISVAALMHVDWIARKLTITSHFDRVIVPGWCQGNLQALTDRFGIPFVAGPRDLHNLPEFFGRQPAGNVALTEWNIEILAEINHAPRINTSELLHRAHAYRDQGADVIDIGCIPGESWVGVGACVRQLTRDGFRVSIDSFDRREVEESVANGAELVLSCNSSNVDWAAQLPAELVAIPDDPRNLSGLDTTIEILQSHGARFRIDPILEPIGCGFAASLARYFAVRDLRPDCAMLMGVGNLTEMTEVDSAGVGMLLAGICEELRIHSVLTTEVINWSRTAVREFDIARRIVHESVRRQVPPKHLDSQLVIARDRKLYSRTTGDLEQLASQITDPNFRIFAENGEFHLMNRTGYWHGTDAFEVFEQALAANTIDATHAFYLGYELQKAVTALTLGKQYEQDEALQWGFLTRPETSAVERHRSKKNDRASV